MKKKEITDQLNVRVPAGLNDYLNDFVKKTRHARGSKVKKEDIVVALLELFRIANISQKQLCKEQDKLDTEIVKELFVEQIKAKM